MNCSLCRDTGYVQRDMAIGVPRRPEGDTDEVVEWLLTVAACSHPKASAKAAEEPRSSRTVVVGADLRPEGRDGSVTGEPVPAGSDYIPGDAFLAAISAATGVPFAALHARRDQIQARLHEQASGDALASQRAAHDARVQADALAYEQRERAT